LIALADFEDYHTDIVNVNWVKEMIMWIRAWRMIVIMMVMTGDTKMTWVLSLRVGRRGSTLTAEYSS
jgi:hypothetical protein